MFAVDSSTRSRMVDEMIIVSCYIQPLMSEVYVRLTLANEYDQIGGQKTGLISP